MTDKEKEFYLILMGWVKSNSLWIKNGMDFFFSEAWQIEINDIPPYLIRILYQTSLNRKNRNDSKIKFLTQGII